MFPLPDRIMDRIDTSAPCWEWTGSLVDGYGQTSIGRTRYRVHRLIYETLVGAVPAGLELDHLCRNRRCCNPDHLEPVTRAENLRRSPLVNNQPLSTHCPNGHEFTPDNTYERPGRGQGRTCRACNRESAARTQRARLDRMIEVGS